MSEITTNQLAVHFSRDVTVSVDQQRRFFELVSEIVSDNVTLGPEGLTWQVGPGLIMPPLGTLGIKS